MGAEERSAAPLTGIRVIDLSTSYAGPTCSMYLADLGADVIKVERPGGDDARFWGPPFVGQDSAWFLSANRGKRGICLDVRRPAGQRVLARLLESADVLLVSFNPTKLESMGLDPTDLISKFPRLVYCLLSGFGLDGPDAGLPGYDLIAQARSGLMSVTGASGGAPQRMSTALADVMAGTVAAMTIAASLLRRDRTGEGELIDVSLLDAALALIAPRMASFAAGEPEPRPSGATDSVLAIYQSFATADSPIVVAVGNDGMWLRFCEAIERPDLALDERLRTNASRRQHRAELIEEISTTLRELPSPLWLARLADARIPCAPVQFLADVLRDPQVQARRSVRPLAHPVTGELPVVDQPWRLGGTERPDTLPAAPTVGQHTVEVMGEAGYSAREIDKLMEEGALWADMTTTS